MGTDTGMSLADYLVERDRLYTEIAAVTGKPIDAIRFEVKQNTNHAATMADIVAELRRMLESAKEA